MELQYKQDFEKSVERFEAWWHRELIDRPPITIPNVRSAPAPQMPARQHATQRDRWMDYEYTVAKFENSLQGAEFLADTFPMLNPNLGPDIVATIFGSELEFGESTSWSHPIAPTCEHVLKIHPTMDNPYWNTVRKMMDLSLQKGKGRWLTGITDLHSSADVLSALRGPENLCLDMMDHLDTAAAACARVTGLFPMIFEDLYYRLAAAGQPAISWLPCVHRGKMYITSCDFICMISPEMFAKTVQPCLQREMQYLEHNIFHLDGPGALRHIDALLAMPELDAIQWVYGEGNGPTTNWIPTYQKIQNAGKCVYVGCYSFAEALEMARNLRPEGLWLRVFGDYGVAEAQAFIREIEKWSAGKKI